MIDTGYSAVIDLIGRYLTAAYSTGTDINTATPIYCDEDFDPQNPNTFSRLKKSTGYSIVVHGESWQNLQDHPHSHLKKELNITVSFVYSTGNMWDTTLRWVRAIAGSASAPLANSIHGVVGNFEKYIRANHIDKNDVISYWQDITSISKPVIHDGKWVVVSCNLRALFMESKTITVTPV